MAKVLYFSVNSQLTQLFLSPISKERMRDGLALNPFIKGQPSFHYHGPSPVISLRQQ
ncbi:hypothetical protein IC006_0658 [Sulfuracidifex tepidarius]|uniref:Uncharacterized protein n=1 Tax=Sulfuracidifex tepidarius TaxID=1294262 RepID=A0A510DT87_9CREN|nr:hypothetical protein IC006_0658 [Sulfuracidifex tepidarius]BBG26127.1 hypothetical protein IC007_0632 [Sulfuracidifex tepidarius]